MTEDRLTNFIVDYEAVNLIAMENATFTVDGITWREVPVVLAPSTFVDPLEDKVYGDFMSIPEHNFTILDGSQVEAPKYEVDSTKPRDEDAWERLNNMSAFYTDIADENGGLSTTPQITITFSEQQDFIGTTIVFENALPRELDAIFYKGNNIIYHAQLGMEDISEKTLISQPITDCTRIVITIPSATPYREIKIKQILFGVKYQWDETVLRNGTLVQELDYLSEYVSIDTLTFDLVDDDNIFNFGNPDGIHDYFQRGQSVTAYEQIGDNRIELGKFFLNELTNSNNIVKFNCTSYMGLLDTINFDGEIYLSGKTVHSVIDDINTKYSLSKYADFNGLTIDDSELSNTDIYGVIYPTTCRDALAQVLFAVGATTEPYRDASGKQVGVNICKKSNSYLSRINREDKFYTTVSKVDYISGVELGYCLFNASKEKTELVTSEVYNPGKYTIYLSEPIVPGNNVLTITGGTKGTDYKFPNYDPTYDSGREVDPFKIDIQILKKCTLTISGTQYDRVEKLIKKDLPTKNVNMADNVKTFTSTLLSKTNAERLMQTIIDYYSKNTLEITIKFLATDNIMNARRYVQNYINLKPQFIGNFNSRTINLTGGFIDTAKLIGRFDDVSHYNYATTAGTLYTELYAGEEGLL